MAGRTAGLAGCVIAGAVGAAASAANAAPQVWQGSFSITVSTTTCDTAAGTRRGDFAVSIFRPRLAASDPAPAISVLFGRAAALYQLNGAGVPVRASGAYAAEGFDGRARFMTPGGFSGTFSAIKVSPTPLSATTPFVTVTGNIKGFNNTPGCDISFSASYERRLD